MLAQLKQAQLNKFIFYPSGHLPPHVEDLLQRIGCQQSNLQKFLSKALTYSEKKLSISLGMFLNESKNRLYSFILTLDEITGHVSHLKQYDSFLIKNLTYSSTSFLSNNKIINEIFTITNLLCDMFIQLQINIEKLESAEFIKDFCIKSLIFYKQTQVVLKGYLRASSENL